VRCARGPGALAQPATPRQTPYRGGLATGSGGLGGHQRGLEAPKACTMNFAIGDSSTPASQPAPALCYIDFGCARALLHRLQSAPALCYIDFRVRPRFGSPSRICRSSASSKLAVHYYYIHIEPKLCVIYTRQTGLSAALTLTLACAYLCVPRRSYTQGDMRARCGWLLCHSAPPPPPRGTLCSVAVTLHIKH